MSFVISDNILEKYIDEPDVTNVIIPDGVTEIAKGVFYGCERILCVISNERR